MRLSQNTSNIVFGSFIVAIATALGFLAGCKKVEEAPKPVVYVQSVHPTRGSISEQITADAVLAPLAQAAISPKVTAPVKKFFAQRGSKVKAGELLATLESRDLEAAVVDNKGAYTAAQASYETTTKATVQEDYTKAELDLAQAKSNLDLNRSIVEARTQLFSQGAMAGRDLDTAKATLVQAQATYDIAKQHLESLKQVSRKAALESAEGQLNSAKGKYLGAEAQFGYSEIHSPIDGVVTDRPLFAGETAAAGSPLITVMDTSSLLAKLHISQMQAIQLKLGSPATLAIPGVEDPVPAEVALISPALDPGSTTVEIWLKVRNPEGRYKVGTPVHATMRGRTATDALIMPVEAVQTAADGVTKSVMIIGDDGVAHKKEIKLGIVTSDSAQVLEGLSAGDNVITTGAYGLDDGTKVKIGAPPADAGEKKADE
jgi:multidrug efflux pump subunit AcrA (membrane-fusion protein)